MTAYAHTHPNHPNDPDYWEPLFTPFGDGAEECQREDCHQCRKLDPDHGHLNKVAFRTAKSASEMFAPDSTEAKAAWEWGYLTGLWHDLGKFATEWQAYLASKADPHAAEGMDDPAKNEDHTTAYPSAMRQRCDGLLSLKTISLDKIKTYPKLLFV